MSCICVNCRNKCDKKYSMYFCVNHLQVPKVSIRLTRRKGDINAGIFGTSYVLKQVGHTYVVQRRNDGLLQSSDKVELIRSGLIYENVEQPSEVICPMCKCRDNSLNLEEYTCGHFYHRECCPDFCCICLGRGKPIIEQQEQEPEIVPKECVVCLTDVKEFPLECGHSIHRGCIARWGSELCPICRKKTELPETYIWLLNRVKEENKRESERQDHEVALRLQQQFGNF
jgi:Ring finger domain